MTQSETGRSGTDGAPKKKGGRWNRVVLSILGLGVGVGGVMAGTHLYGQHYVKSQIVGAFEQAARTGAVAKYGEIEVSGFIVPNTGIARDVDIYVPSLDMRVQLPQVVVDPRSLTTGSVQFSLPEQFDIQITDADGLPIGRVLKVTGQDLQATINSDGDEVYEFGVSSGTTRIAEEVDSIPTGGYYDFEELDAQGRILVTPGTSDVTASATFDAASLVYAAPPALEGGPAQPNFEAVDMTGSAELDSDRAKVTFTAGSMRNLNDPSTEFSAERMDVALVITPKAGESFDLTPLAQFETVDDFVQTLAGVLATSLATGATLDEDVTIGALKIVASDLPDPQQQYSSIQLDATDFAFKIDAGPEVLSSNIDATTFILDMKGQQGLYYDIRGLAFALAATPSEQGFDFSPLAALPTPDMGGQVFFDILRQEIIAGGDAQLSFAVGGYDSTVQINDPLSPLTSMAMGSGAGETVISIDADSIDLVSNSESAAIQLAGQIAGRVDTGPARSNLTIPIAAAPNAQAAKLFVEQTEVVVSDDLWAAVDPAGVLDHTISGVTIDAEMDLTLYAGLLTEPEAFQGPFPPVEPGAITINDVTLDMLGAKIAATGEVETVPVPAGSVDLRLSGWRELLDGLAQTPLGQDPSFVSSILLARGFIEQFGQPGDADGETKMLVTFNGPEVSVNGIPLAPPQ